MYWEGLDVTEYVADLIFSKFNFGLGCKISMKPSSIVFNLVISCIQFHQSTLKCIIINKVHYSSVWLQEFHTFKNTNFQVQIYMNIAIWCLQLLNVDVMKDSLMWIKCQNVDLKSFKLYILVLNHFRLLTFNIGSSVVQKKRLIHWVFYSVFWPAGFINCHASS